MLFDWVYCCSLVTCTAAVIVVIGDVPVRDNQVGVTFQQQRSTCSNACQFSVVECGNVGRFSWMGQSCVLASHCVQCCRELGLQCLVCSENTCVWILDSGHWSWYLSYAAAKDELQERCSNLHSLKWYSTVWRYESLILPLNIWVGLSWFENGFYPRDAMLARVIEIATCLSVCPSRAGIVSKGRKLAAWFLHHMVAPRL